MQEETVCMTCQTQFSEDFFFFLMKISLSFAEFSLESANSWSNQI